MYCDLSLCNYKRLSKTYFGNFYSIKNLKRQTVVGKEKQENPGHIQIEQQFRIAGI